MGRRPEALRELERLDAGLLSQQDKVWLYRARANLLGLVSSYFDALPNARAAWREVQGLPEFPLIGPWVLISYADILSQTGEDEKALYYLRRARTISENEDQWYAQLNYANVLVKLGRLEEAEEEIQALRSTEPASGPAVALSLLLGRHAWMAGDLNRAIQHYREAATVAEAALDDVRACQAHGYLAALLASQGDGQSRQHLARAEGLVRTEAARLTTGLYGTYVRLRFGDICSSEAFEKLRNIHDHFARSGETHDQRWAQLHVCEAARHVGGETFDLQLLELHTLVQRYQNAATLAKDWFLLPELHRAIGVQDAFSLGAQKGQPSELWTLGEERLVVNGETVHLPFRRGIEILAFLLERRQATLGDILSHVFADDSPEKARNYLHQLRHVLAERVPGLTIDYSKETKMYSLLSAQPIWWDVAEVRTGRHLPHTLLFLPSSGSEWAQQVSLDLHDERDRSAPVMDQGLS